MHIDSGITLMTKEDIIDYWESQECKSGEIKDVSPSYFNALALEENYQDYKESSLKIVTSICDFKCCTEQGIDVSVCANHSYANNIPNKVKNKSILAIYNNMRPFCSSIVFGGLEPLKQLVELYGTCKYLRDNGVEDDIVIYTGYYPHELNPHDMLLLISLKKVIIKFGRYIPNTTSRYDEVLGVVLASKNQFAVRF